MKRSRLLRRTPLARTGLRTRPNRENRTDPGRLAWKEPRSGYCQCGCHRFHLRLEHHHVLALQTIKREGRLDLAWDPRNGMFLHPLCHARHTNAVRRISLEAIPEAALAFAVDLLGEERAADYVRRQYRCGERSDEDRWAA